MSSDAPLRVLFVDDDARLLDGLRRAMHAHRESWSMAFALGGGEALSRLASEPVDIVISDMRMPGMDGAALLTEVARAHPHTIRIVLSGQSHTEAAQRALRVAHQFLGKPIAPSALAETITRLTNARALLGDVALRTRASSVSTLPASPEPYDNVTRLCADDGAIIADLVAAIACDPAMAAKALHLASSAFFGPPLRTRGIAAAVGYIGLDNVRTIAGAAELATSGCLNAAQTAAVVALQRHSLLVAHIARRIVPDPRLADDAFSAGLLHDVGKLIVLDLPADPLHAEIGAYLLGIWGLPKEIVAAVAHHHAPSRAPGDSVLAGVIHAANALAHEHMEEDGWEPAAPLDARALEAAGMTAAMPDWHVFAAEESATLRSTRGDDT